jgi:hypothetical protein
MTSGNRDARGPLTAADVAALLREDPQALDRWAGCGPLRGERRAWKCHSCGLESDDIEDFNIGTCWECCHRASWSDMCQQERHEECEHGDPDDPEFCPCPHHDEAPDAPAATVPPDRAVPGPPPGAALSCPRFPAGGQGPGLPGPSSPSTLAGQAPDSPALATSGAGSGRVEPPRPAPPRPARGAAHTAPGATAGTPPAPTPVGVPAPQAPSPPPAPEPDPPGRGGEGQPSPPSRGGGADPAGGDAIAAAAPLAGQQWRDAVRTEQARQARGRRNARGRRPSAARAARQGPGMARRMPPGGEAS